MFSKQKRGIDLKSMPTLGYRQVPMTEHRQDLHPSWDAVPVSIVLSY